MSRNLYLNEPYKINTIPEESTNLLLIKSRNIAFFVEKLTLEIWPQTFNCRPSSLQFNSKSSLEQKYIYDWLNKLQTTQIKVHFNTK